MHRISLGDPAKMRQLPEAVKRDSVGLDWGAFTNWTWNEHSRLRAKAVKHHISNLAPITGLSTCQSSRLFTGLTRIAFGGF